MAVCYHFARGHCRYGDKCRYPHVPSSRSNPSGPPRVTTSANNTSNHVPRQPPKPVDITIDENFLSAEGVNAPFSDTLIHPVDARTAKVALGVIRGMEFSGQQPDSVAETETLIWALSQTNAHNPGWTFAERQIMLNDVTKLPKVSNNKASAENISFSKRYMALIGYFTSAAVIQTAAITQTNALYSILDVNLAQVLQTLEKNIVDSIDAGSFEDSARRMYGQRNPNGLVQIRSGIQVFKPVIAMLYEYVKRFRNAPTLHPQLVEFVSNLKGYFNDWAEKVEWGTIRDPLAARDVPARKVILTSVRKSLQDVSQLISNVLPKFQEAEQAKNTGPSAGLLAMIEREYDGPGELSAEGQPRHTNDHVHIRDIEIPPTGDEMSSRRPAYIPVNIPGAKHALPDGMAKILDIQFRLLRADSFSGLQQGIHAVSEDYGSEDFSKTELAQRFREGGGWYIDHSSSRDSVRLPIFTNVHYTGVSLDQRRGLVVNVTADAPPGRARATKMDTRLDFWRGGKRMPQGGLVAVVTKYKDDPTGDDLDVAIAILTTFPDKFKHHSNPDGGCPRFSFGLHFIDDHVGMEAVRVFQQGESRNTETRFILESPVLYEAVRPFLQTIQNHDDLRLPLQKYLTNGDLEGMSIDMPQHMQLSQDRFWDLSCLLKEDSDVTSCQFSPHNEVSIANAREMMHAYGKLDPSQSDAVIDSLCREMSLIQGPPGTGKTYTGVELLRVLFANKAGPVLLLAFTNHALDHILRAIHDAGVTKNIIRLGSRSKDEVVAEYSLENLGRVKGHTTLNSIVNRRYAETKAVEEELSKVLHDLLETQTSAKRLASYVQIHYPSLMQSLDRPPPWVGIWLQLQEVGQWQRATSRKKKRNEISGNPEWEFWTEGADIDSLCALHNQDPDPHPDPTEPVPVPPTKSKTQHTSDDEDRRALASLGADFLMDDVPDIDDDEAEEIAAARRIDDSDSESQAGRDFVVERTGPTREEAAEDRRLFLEFFDLHELPPIPTTKRSVDELLFALETGGSAWDFSKHERLRLVREIQTDAKRHLDEDSMATFEQLARRHQEARTNLQEANDNVRVSLLDKIDLVGATTNGAAKLGSVMMGFAPKVLVIEEAGQVLEAHVLSALFPSIQHVIAIGDPLQLRPSVNLYEFSMDNPRGRDLFRFDMSLMERLASGGLPMSQLRVQRRMTPPVSSLIRNTLYPDLLDHGLVHEYPSVTGMGKNLFFYHHTNQEKGGGDSGSSKSNPFEAAMACDLALYLLKQGCYSQEGDIVILCAYLGQVVEVRDQLKGRATIIIDERDQDKLVQTFGDGDDEAEPPVVSSQSVAKHVQLDKQVFVRTIDNFQGEEAAVVILSLVRNEGADEKAKSTIGFLKSRNRTNVSISRAKHGMYILGNADHMASSSEMWRTIVQELEDNQAIGEALPIMCKRHQEPMFVDAPGQLDMLSPDGGCLRPCDAKLVNCGHRCSRKCHADDAEHLGLLSKCQEKCSRLHPACGHPCPRICADDCGKCLVPLESIQLPCGHTADIFCWQSENLEVVRCTAPVSKALPYCEHSATVPCYLPPEDLPDIECSAPCNAIMSCCSKACTGRCDACRRKTTIRGAGRKNKKKAPLEPEPGVPVERTEHVAHPCGGLVPDCDHACEYTCGTQHTHSTTTCIAPCHRACDHGQCPSPCHQPCAPCAESCTWTCEHHGSKSCGLPCGMPCDRLPCDEFCQKILGCGHPCTSLCGEPCQTQVCTSCATPSQLDQVVDFIMQTTLRETVKDDPLVRLITLECGHLFTAETLDGHMDLNAYYTKDGSTWTGLLSPSGYQKRKTCPTCRASVTSPRYNRVTKRALLDLQEQVAVATMSTALAHHQDRIRSLNIAEINKGVQKALNKVVPGKAGRFEAKRMATELGTFTPQMLHCIEPGPYFRCDKGNNIFGVPPVLGKAWRKAVDKHLALYTDLAKVVNSNRMPHNVAYENAVSSIYWQELEISRKSATSATRDPSKAALLTARRRLGAPPPGGQAVFAADALCLTIEVRLSMFNVATMFVNNLWNGSGLTDRKNTKGTAQKPSTGELNACRKAAATFQKLATGILLSCKRDAELLLSLATKAQLPIPMLKANFMILNVAFEIVSSKAQAALRTAESGGRDRDARRAKVAEDMEAQSLTEREKATRTFEKALGLLRMEHKSNVKFMEVAIETGNVAKELISSWVEFEKRLSTGVWYTPLSTEERQAIVSAITARGYNTDGRFYQCPNGHPYVVGNCGQAMEESQCLECGARIGGANHQLRDDNARDAELDALARKAGAARNPWVEHFARQ